MQKNGVYCGFAPTYQKKISKRKITRQFLKIDEFFGFITELVSPKYQSKDVLKITFGIFQKVFRKISNMESHSSKVTDDRFAVYL